MVTWEDLEVEQRRAADSEDRTLLVLGGAGTGKTTTALWAARREMDRQDARGRSPHARVLFLTFSRTAVTTILERSAAVLPERYRQRVEVTTFHGFGWRIARDFGRYAGLGPQPPRLTLDAEQRLLGNSATGVTYDSLVGIARQLISAPLIGDILRSRWTLVICDEFQDTSDEQWELLELLGELSRLLLLGDQNQMIYQWLEGVGTHRFDVARSRKGVREIDLPRQSHRDPSQLISAAAEAILHRNFDSSDLRDAVAASRLQILAGPDHGEAEYAIVATVEDVIKQRGASVGVFTQRVASVEQLCGIFARRGLRHTPIGLGEGLPTALWAHASVVQACLGWASWLDACKSLAIFLTSLRRGAPTEAALLLLRGEAMQPRQQAWIDDLRRRVQACADLPTAAAVAEGAWPQLRFQTLTGDETWARASLEFRSVIAKLMEPRDLASAMLTALVDELATDHVLGMQQAGVARLQIMTLAQTKGREFDETLVCFANDDYFGREKEWRRDTPRLLYVTMTRARQRTTILLPPEPHPVVAPLAVWARRA